jgi:oligopeptidase A
MQNPLLEIRFEVPFDRIAPAHVVPVVHALVREAEARIDAIGESEVDYAHTLGELERATETLEWTMTVVGHLEAVATTPPLRDAYNAVQPVVSSFYSGIALKPKLYDALKRFAQTAEAEALSPTKKRLLEKTLREFKRHGAELSDEGKARLRQIDVALAEKTTKFGQNVLDSTQSFELYVDDESRLAGLPETARHAARASAKAKGKSGYRFTLQAPSVVPVLTYAEDASLREAIYRAFNARATSGATDNRGLIMEILKLRDQRSALLGYADFSDLVLEERMAKRGDAAMRFVDDLREKTLPAFAAENAALEAFRKALEGPDAAPFRPWDLSFYAERQRRARFDFDEEQLRPYFPVDRVLAGLFSIVERLYGVAIRKCSMPTWDPAVETYGIHDDGGTMRAAFYVDLYPRENKRDGAWMNPILTGMEGKPHLGLFCANVNPPIDGKPALLTHAEVETLFHEFGHLLHHAFTRVEVRSLAGTNVAWDFVELPSQIMENWCWEREALDHFARHHETGEPIPEPLFQKMLAARTYRAANAQMRQLGFATLDLMLHREYVKSPSRDLFEYAREVAGMHSPVVLEPDYAMLASFGHLFASPTGYAAGYYSYKWAEVLDADAFSRFAREGVLSPEVGRAFRECILEKGDSADPAELYRAFMGRDPKLEPLLERSGLLAA